MKFSLLPACQQLKSKITMNFGLQSLMLFVLCCMLCSVCVCVFMCVCVLSARVTPQKKKPVQISSIRHLVSQDRSGL